MIVCRMDTTLLRKFCRSLPHVAEDVKWGDNLCFLIGERMFCITSLDRTAPAKLSFKCDPDGFTELIERDSIVPAAYMARNHWVSLERWDALRDSELKSLVRASYDLVKSRLPKKTQARLSR